MGYTTEFRGSLEITPKIKQEHREYINAFSSTRRMSRDQLRAETLDDPKRLAAGLPIGEYGGYFVGNEQDYGQVKDSSVLDYNIPPKGQPGLWCQWIINDAGELDWDEGEKFYNYVEWLQYLIDNFFKPWGYSLNGIIRWRGEDFDDTGTIVVATDGLVVK